MPPPFFPRGRFGPRGGRGGPRGRGSFFRGDRGARGGGLFRGPFRAPSPPPPPPSPPRPPSIKPVIYADPDPNYTAPEIPPSPPSPPLEKTHTRNYPLDNEMLLTVFYWHDAEGTVMDSQSVPRGCEDVGLGKHRTVQIQKADIRTYEQFWKTLGLQYNLYAPIGMRLVDVPVYWGAPGPLLVERLAPSKYLNHGVHNVIKKVPDITRPARRINPPDTRQLWREVVEDAKYVYLCFTAPDQRGQLTLQERERENRVQEVYFSVWPWQEGWEVEDNQAHWRAKRRDRLALDRGEYVSPEEKEKLEREAEEEREARKREREMRWRVNREG
ncbi:hypothetical protein EDC01DRAFT_634719 [Geopyxis carbonaria]|nr:hypothetical protein EDC01DRAFT_634719 [Geopyxis carbonaria]